MNKPISDPLVKIKTPNYTKEQVKEMRELYLKYPCRDTVNSIAESFNKSERSIIAKLSNMGDYIPPKRTTKSGTPIIKKETLVEQIAAKLEIEVPSLVKANKKDLETLLASLNEWLGD